MGPHCRTKHTMDRVPDDILMLLFETAHLLFLEEHEVASKDFTKQLMRHYFHFRRSLAGVCRRWYDISARLPALWTKLYRGPEHPGQPWMTVARSGIHPLQVLATGPQLLKFCGDAPGVAQRIEHLEIQDHMTFRSMDVFSQLGRTDWPRLKSFFIEEMSGACCNTNRSLWVPLASITDFLRRCPALQELRMSSLTYRLPSEGDTTLFLGAWKLPAPATLHDLKVIKLAHMKGADIKALLSSLDMPKLTALHLYGAYGIGSPLPSVPCIPSLRELRFDKCHWEWHGIYEALEAIPNVNGLALSTIAGRGILRRLIRGIEEHASSGRVFLGRLKTFELSLRAECDKQDLPDFVDTWQKRGLPTLDTVIVHSGREEKGMRTLWATIASHVTILWTFG
ncbi:hypothetical protein CALVIDRAFT_245647 [Calocera viscosa TUFC12733]|uniref:Uncharacterized protein n=1 Tax=Calocera viscosa (strain TUFC12733) TaxID=1330018 RepID=A0A167JI78_CALVF|nr:hypothetical protein CALVIDRAFT_245647 [Calocera viscosa TUFC12733]